MKLKEYINLTIGCLLIAIATSYFLLPNKLSSGGFAGISTVVYYLFNIPLGITMLILNIPLFIFAKIRMGNIFVIEGLVGTILLSIFIDVLDTTHLVLTHDKLLACIYGGVIIGIGTALVLKGNASTGGTEMLANIFQTYKENIKISSLLNGIDMAIVTLNVLVFRDIEIGLYSAIAIYIMGKMIDIVFEGIHFTKTIFIISDKYESIAKKIGDQVARGSTLIYAKGMFKGDERKILLCIASRNQIGKIKNICMRYRRKSFYSNK